MPAPGPARVLLRSRVRLLLLFAAASFALFPAGAQGPASPATPSAAPPKVRLVATGGTISNRGDDRLSADELLRSVPSLDRYVRAEREQFSNVASAELTLDQLLALARRINTLFRDDNDLAGVVVTSGTDTLEEIAYFLNLTVSTDRPVVVVGSMRRPGAPGYEGPANLLAGFRVAAEPASRGRGVLVVLDGEIHSAREATKTHALRLEAFQAPGYGPLGVVDGDAVVYYRTGVKRHTAAAEFDVFRVRELPRVDIVLVYQGASGDLIKAAVDRGARGVVIAAAGAGATSGTQRDGIRYAVSKGVFVVTSTRTGAGRIAVSREKGLGENGASGASYTIAAEDLAPLKARILLMLALTATNDGAEVQRMFTEY